MTVRRGFLRSIASAALAWALGCSSSSNTGNAPQDATFSSDARAESATPDVAQPNDGSGSTDGGDEPTAMDGAAADVATEGSSDAGALGLTITPSSNAIPIGGRSYVVATITRPPGYTGAVTIELTSKIA